LPTPEYRYSAIRLEENGSTNKPLNDYFKPILEPAFERDRSIFEANMYLAEDRILCFALIAAEGKRWTMHYVKNATAVTDVPMTLEALMKQRRRWLNGSLFAMFYSLGRFDLIWTRTAHSLPMKILLTFQFAYFLFNQCLGLLLPGMFYLTLTFVVQRAIGSEVTWICQLIYLAMLLIQLVMSLANCELKSKSIVRTFEVTSGILSIMTLFAFFITIFSLITGGAKLTPAGDDYTDAALACGSILPDIWIYAFAVILIGSPLIGAVFAFEYKAVLSSYIHYVVMLPVYVNTMSIYAIANLHDISWGTKGLEGVQAHAPQKKDKSGQTMGDYRKEQERLKQAKIEEQKHKDQKRREYQAFRTLVLLTWMLSNLMLMAFIGEYVPGICFLLGLAFIACSINLIKIIGLICFTAGRVKRRLFPTNLYSAHKKYGSYQRPKTAKTRKILSNADGTTSTQTVHTLSKYGGNHVKKSSMTPGKTSLLPATTNPMLPPTRESLSSSHASFQSSTDHNMYRTLDDDGNDPLLQKV
jgi:chitin synthase